MPKQPKTTVLDFAEDEFLDAGIEAIKSEFANWQTTDGQGTRQLWSMLGRVYELGGRVENNGTIKHDLIAKVEQDPNVKGNPRWDSSKKTAHELLLVLFLSLKEDTKAKKSQWFSAIRAAETAKIEAKADKFLAFMEDMGGIDGARKSIARPAKPKQTFEELVAAVSEWAETDNPSFISPTLIGEGVSLPSGIGLVLVKGGIVGGEVTPIATITNSKIVEEAMRRFLVEYDAAEIRQQRDLEAGFQEAAKVPGKKLKLAYKKRKKSPVGKSHPLEFEEYVEEMIDTDIELEQLARKIPNLKERIINGSNYAKWHR